VNNFRAFFVEYGGSDGCAVEHLWQRWVLLLPLLLLPPPPLLLLLLLLLLPLPPPLLLAHTLRKVKQSAVPTMSTSTLSSMFLKTGAFEEVMKTRVKV
jgi:hypothetical protein